MTLKKKTNLQKKNLKRNLKKIILRKKLKKNQKRNLKKIITLKKAVPIAELK